MLYAVLVSSILLSIGLAIFNLTIKELLLSSLGRDSQFAFYAADSGAECALYWDFKEEAFATSSVPGPIECADVVIDNMGGKGYGGSNDFTIYLDQTLSDPSKGPCTLVSVTKYDSPLRTILEARGYNTCDPTNPRRVERAIRVTY
jgi:hypothetical protein